ncbi:MAG: hypothetical protein CFE26_08290 [Verrucomicrobiales bacterium VVV1]|nr:MAG: hypothetical protein CFE26_08290 [Verrucomicrobiales bacterium VVV1]
MTVPSKHKAFSNQSRANQQSPADEFFVTLKVSAEQEAFCHRLEPRPEAVHEVGPAFKEDLGEA